MACKCDRLLRLYTLGQQNIRIQECSIPHSDSFCNFYKELGPDISWCLFDITALGAVGVSKDQVGILFSQRGIYYLGGEQSQAVGGMPVQ